MPIFARTAIIEAWTEMAELLLLVFKDEFGSTKNRLLSAFDEKCIQGWAVISIPFSCVVVGHRHLLTFACDVAYLINLLVNAFYALQPLLTKF